MADRTDMKIEFLKDGGGHAHTDSGYTVSILDGENSARPYELLFMALGSCLYATFQEIFRKKRLNCDSVSVCISGEKREAVPKYLSKCIVDFTVRGADKRDGFEKAFELACKYCSVYQTLAKVAEMKPEIHFG